MCRQSFFCLCLEMVLLGTCNPTKNVSPLPPLHLIPRARESSRQHVVFLALSTTLASGCPGILGNEWELPAPPLGTDRASIASLLQTKDAVFTLSAMTSGIRRNWIEALRKNVRPVSAPDVTK